MKTKKLKPSSRMPLPLNNNVDGSMVHQYDDSQALRHIISSAEAELERIEGSKNINIDTLNITINYNSFNDYSTESHEETTTTTTDTLSGLGFFLLFFGIAIMMLGFSASRQQPVIIHQQEVVSHGSK